jgi:1-deoxy-D-xylulose 5-phosphate reductoisomerase
MKADQLVTREQILAAKGRELDILVAIHIYNFKDVSIEDAEKIDSGDVYIPHYSTDFSMAYEMEEELKKITKPDMYLTISYALTLPKVIKKEKGQVTPFDYIHATPEQRCKAALLAVLEAE